MIRKYNEQINYWFKNEKSINIGLWTIASFFVGDCINSIFEQISGIDSFIIDFLIGAGSIYVIWYLASKIFKNKD